MSALALPSENNLSLSAIIGSSIQLSQYLWPQSESVTSKESGSNKLTGFQVSTGISPSANTIQQQVEKLTVEWFSWSVQHDTVQPIDVEHEVVTLMPPKERQVVTVQVYSKGRAQPLERSEQPISYTSSVSLWNQLAQAAQTHNAQAFVMAYQAIDWTTRSPAEFARAIQWALTAGAHLTARSLATAGAAQYPDDAELQKAARILAPPKLLRRLPAEPEKRANHEWLRVNRTAYRGKWVALRNGHLLATANAFRELTEQVTIAPDILFTKVF